MLPEMENIYFEVPSKKVSCIQISPLPASQTPIPPPFLPKHEGLLIHLGIRGFRRNEVSLMSSLRIGFMLDGNLALQVV